MPGSRRKASGLHVSGASHANSVTFRIGNCTAEIAKIAEGVNRFGADHGLSKSVLNAVNVALDEVLNNTINYGYADNKRHEIIVSLSLEPGELVAEIKDDGIAFDPLAVPAPDLSGRLHERELGGIGVHFVRSLMDDIKYVRKGGANRLRLSKRLVTQENPDGHRRRTHG
jgi:anti-sigma regulatory factor (Ser/Thr protein kinase)